MRNHNKCYRTKKEQEREVKQRHREKKSQMKGGKKTLTYLAGKWVYEIDGFLHIPFYKDLLCMFVFH